MNAADFDFETAHEAGDLSLHTEEAYLEDGEFDPEAMVDFLENRTAAVTDEEGYEGLRIAGEATWALDDDQRIDNLVEYEEIINDFFAANDCIATCIYDRERFPASVLEEIIRTHPRVVYDGTVMQNVYYVPPEERSGEADPPQTVERQMQTLIEHTNELHESRELLADQKRTLERLAKGASLNDVLETLIRGIENYSDGVRGSILVRQPGKERFGLVAAPHLPQSYPETLQHTSISPPYLGPCDKSTHAGETVVCDNIETDTRWKEEWRDLVVEHDLHSCHFTPIVGSDEEVLGSFGLYSTQIGDTLPDQEILDTISNIAGIAIERARAEEELQTNEKQMRGQKEAFQAAINGAPLKEALSILGSIVTEEMAGEARTAFYMADSDGTCLHPIRGAGSMSKSYMTQMDGLDIGKDSLACGLATATGSPVLTRDVFDEPRWESLIHLAKEYDFRSCWSFPIKTRDGKPVGTFAMYFRTAREASPRDLALVEGVTQAAAIIISRHTEAQERARAEEEVQERKERLRAIFDGTYEYIGLLDTDGTLLDTNRASLEYADNTREDVVGKPFWETPWFTNTPGAPAKLREAIARAAEGEFVRYEAPLQRPSGETIVFDFSLHPIETEDGELEYIVPEGRDITKRKETEEQLRESEKRLSAFVTASSDVVYRMSPDWTEMHHLEGRGFLADTDEASTTWVDEYIPDADQQQIWKTIGEAIQAQSIFELEHRVVQEDGTIGWTFSRAIPLLDNEGTIAEWFGTATDITERKQREQQLERQREQIEQLKDRLLDTSPMGILVVDTTGEITLANDRATDILGRSREDLVGLAHNAPELGLVDQHGEPLPAEQLPVERVKASDGPVFGLDIGATRPDGQRLWLSVNAAPLYRETDEPTETVIALEDITQHKQTNDALAHLNDASRELMNVEWDEITERAPGIVQAVLDVEYTSLWCYEEAAGDLQRQASSTASEVDPDDIRYPEQFEERAWQAFISDTSEVDNDLPPAADSAPTESPIRSGAIVPLGRHGIIYAGATQPNAFDATTVDLAETVAANIETALDRAADDQQLEAQNTELTRLNQINTIIREIDQGLVQADTRDEIDRIVCDRLAASDRYEFAWIGEIEPGTDTVTPREWAGVDPGYLDALEITTDETETGRGPVGTALRTREQQVVEDIVTDARFVPWREQTLERDVRSCISVPLCYEDSLYGVLTVYAAQPLNDTGYEVLSELGETIGHAINAVETKRTLQTDSVVELSLQLHEPDTVLWRLAQQAACTIEVEGLVPVDDAPTVFVTVDGASADEIHRLSTDSISIESVTCLTESEDGCRCKAVIGGTTLASAIIAEEALIRSLTIEESAVTAVVDLSQTGDVRPFVESIQSQFPSTDLIARRTRNRSLASEQNVQTAVAERMTDRQQEVLRTAYLSGFFEMPRESTGQEIADFLDVSPPTFTQHLRRGQHTLFELLFDGV